MKTKLIALSALTALAATTAWSTRAQEAPPVAGPHQQLLERWVGTWEAECSMMGMVFEATETNRQVGDFWIASDFEADFMGQPFHGHSVFGWSDSHEAYISTWVSSMDASFELMEGQWDENQQQLVMSGKSTGMLGAEVQQRSVGTFEDPDTYVVEMTHDEQPFMTIRYTRQE